MNDWIEKIDKLDLSVFAKIPSQTGIRDRRSLLAVQRATARRHKDYRYLEIGSHLGGSIQPHLVDDRCKKIYSIDARPSSQADDSSPGHVVNYPNNSTDRMLDMLRGIGYGDVTKIECFDFAVSKIDPSKITSRPQIAFIDGEHTGNAVFSDFQFCSNVLSEDGTILFHDLNILYKAIMDICKLLDKQLRSYMPLKLEGDVFAIIFDSNIVHSDPYLTSVLKRQKYLWLDFYIKMWLRKLLPNPLLERAMGILNIFRK